MGLDISAYSKVNTAALIGNIGNVDEVLESVYFYANRDFADRADGIATGEYALSDDHDYHVFRAGSYGSYNLWRNELAQIAGYPAAPDRHGALRYDQGAWAATEGPFWELINFSDCEGAFGPKTAAKLAKDFADFESKIEHENSYFKQVYADFKTAFELAADEGCVNFH